jgi:hypothetical protein
MYYLRMKGIWSFYRISYKNTALTKTKLLSTKKNIFRDWLDVKDLLQHNEVE